MPHCTAGSSDLTQREYNSIVEDVCAPSSDAPLQTMLVPRLRMNAALSGPADEFFLIPKGENRTAPKEPMKVNNPETYLKYVMGKLKVPVRRVRNPDDFPITDGRCEKGKLFCVVHHAKDCRPRSSVDIPDCKEDYFKKNV